jgi:hypothetical protein
MSDLHEVAMGKITIYLCRHGVPIKSVGCYFCNMEGRSQMKCPWCGGPHIGTDCRSERANDEGTKREGPTK